MKKIRQLSSTSLQVYMKTHYILTNISITLAISTTLKLMLANFPAESARDSLSVQIFATNMNLFVMNQQD